MQATNRRRGQSGQIFVWTAFLLPILLVAAGLTFDVGNMINIRDEFTGSIDAAALAGARALHDPGTTESFVRNSAKDVAYANQVPSLAKNGKTSNPVVLTLNATNSAAGDIVLGTYDHTARVFTPLPSPVDLSKANAVKVNGHLGQNAGTLPLAFGKLLGSPSYDTARTAIASLGGPISAQPTAPVAINRDVFTGKTKGFTPPDDIVVSIKLGNMAWTGFLGSSNASVVAGYISNPDTIPTLKLGDTISLAGGNQGGNFQAMHDNFQNGDILIAPVVSFDAGVTNGVVYGFASMSIDSIVTNGTKTIDATLASFKSGKTSKTTTGECYALDCRSFLVN
jgi:Flp pilus assembly protein TadG